MWRYKVEQKSYSIGKVQIGGHPGKTPTVLIGTIFHRKHRIRIDEVKGIFDKVKVEELINFRENFQTRLGFHVCWM
jgi:tetrahydromethanopterin S-methyltransferase subunit H